MRVRKRLITVQPSSYVDHITADGAQLTKKPYPFSALPDGTLYPRGSRGEVSRLVGFVADSARHEVDLYWEFEFLNDPQKAVGMCLVVQNADGSMATQVTAIESVNEREVWIDEADVVIDPDNPTLREGRHRFGEEQ